MRPIENQTILISGATDGLGIRELSGRLTGLVTSRPPRTR